MMGGAGASEAALVWLRDLVRERTGHDFADGQLDWMWQKLEPRVAELGLTSALDYYYLLKYDPGAEREWVRLHSAITVNESYFWREADALRAAAEVLVPQALARGRDPVRLWHAGCAAGEEPYSLALALADQGPGVLEKVEIVATDLDVEALERAEAGLFRERSLRFLPIHLKARWFRPNHDGRFRLDPEVRGRVRFQELNLMDVERLRKLGRFDVIFCRNVFIYFHDEAIRRTAMLFHEQLREPGHLFVGSAESLLRHRVPLLLDEVDGALVYMRSAAGEAS